MKKISVIGSLGLLALGYTGFAAALNTCAQDQGSNPTISGPTSSAITGNNCNNNISGASTISNVCSNAIGTSGAGADVYALQIGNATNSVTIQVTQTGTGANAWFPGVYVMKSNANNCGGNGQTCEGSPEQANSATSITSTLTSNLPVGTYYIVVTDGPPGTGDAGCGPYSMSVSGALPVKLQKFSVK